VVATVAVAVECVAAVAAETEADVVVDVADSAAVTGVDAAVDVVAVRPEVVVVTAVAVAADVVVPLAQRVVLRLSSSPTDTPVFSSLAARRISSSPKT